MKQFEAPELEILRFQTTDIITSSGDELPFLPYAAYEEDEMELAEY